MKFSTLLKEAVLFLCRSCDADKTRLTVNGLLFLGKLLCQCSAVFCHKQKELVMASAYNSKVNVHITNIGGCYFGGSCFKRLRCMAVKQKISDFPL